MRRILRLVLVNFAIFASLLLVLAIALEIFLRTGDTRIGSADKRRGQVPNYEGAAWPQTHFREFEELETTFFSFVEWRRAHFQGETINVVGPFHERLTVQAEGAKGGAVFFFGGSTMWGTGSRDHETIPSVYGRLAGRPTRNFGESGYVAHQNLEMLLWVLAEGERPAAVVFYDGVNDVVQKCRSGASLFSQGQEGRMRVLLEPHHGFFLRAWAPVQARLSQVMESGGSEDRFDCDDDPEKARRVADGLIREWQLGAMVAQSEGIAFFAALQPVVYLSNTITDQRADSKKSQEDRRAQFEAVYPLIRARLGEIGAIDLTTALDEQALFYVDFCHLSPNGNERIAAALARVIEPRLAAQN